MNTRTNLACVPPLPPAAHPPLPVAEVTAKAIATVPDEAGYANFFVVSMHLHPASPEVVAMRWHRLQPRERGAYREGAAAAIDWDDRKDGERDPVGTLVWDLDACEGAMRAGAVELVGNQRLALHSALARLTLALIETGAI